MKLRFLYGLTALLVAGGCGRDGREQPDAAAMDMTPEEHARMMAGGTQGATDTTGQAIRQAVHLTAEQERALGVVYTTVRRGSMTRTIRTVGQIVAPEPMIADVTPKIDGFVEQLFVNFTGDFVRKGAPLLTIYSPMLVAAQQELLTAKRLAAQVDSAAGEAWRSAQATLASARRRLAYWDITAEQIEQIERTGEITKTLTLVAPVSGIVLEKQVLQGQQVMPGMRLYRIADLSTVWAEGDVFEQDLQFVRAGSQAHIEVAAYPGEHLMGRVSFVYPTVNPDSRTNRVRVSVPNPTLRLKPGMYATIYFDVTIGPGVLVVPMDAIVVTGERNLVFVRGSDGVLTPREVVLGARAGNMVQILTGLTEGETVVAAANFLVDAESRLATTGSAMPGMQHAGDRPAAPAAKRDTMPGMRHDTMPAGHRHD
ncbi:MAG TPA: efflux RND transporter periplasmic adaptor subunit [Gemmatimonadales bacterium]|nr:efflux RND transporter periplasmic adaptor subunit [Gemmatimonadales bacterium]